MGGTLSDFWTRCPQPLQSCEVYAGEELLPLASRRMLPAVGEDRQEVAHPASWMLLLRPALRLAPSCRSLRRRPASVLGACSGWRPGSPPRRSRRTRAHEGERRLVMEVAALPTDMLVLLGALMGSSAALSPFVRRDTRCCAFCNSRSALR